MAETGDTPTALLEKPEIEDHLGFVWSAFWALSGDRQIVAGGVGVIPFTAINDYAARYGINDLDEFERFRALIKSIDTAFVIKANAKTD